MAQIGKTLLDSGWLAARSTEVNDDGEQLTTTNPPSLGPKSPWMEAAVPGTVLGTLLKNKSIPDPFYGLENETITDIADSGRDYYTFWFSTQFHCKRLLNQYVHLNFRAINYSAEVYVNGHEIVLPKGMFRRHTLDVTDILRPDSDNLLAVIVHPPDHPGTIPPQGGQGGDHEIGKDVAAQYVEGWDWICPIRDRNTGIWDEVSISVTGPVRIIDPHLVSTFYDDYERAYLHVTAELENKSTWNAECSVNIQVTAELENGVCLVEHLHTENVLIPARGNIHHTFKPLYLYKPELWWPNGMGKQNLYDVLITVAVKEFGESDSWMQPFGFRKIESVIDSATGGRLFKVNGEPIFIRGGNWILSDGLLRLSKERYRTDIKFHADMNVNMIRCWGGGLAERPEFYHFCDVYGLLVWQEFWITGDVDGRGDPVSNPNGPLDHDLFLLCARDTIKLLRNHPSLALWVGGNEQVPPEDINEALKQDLRLHPYFTTQLLPDQDSDPSVYLDGTRVYIQGSMWDGFADGKGNFTDGPYKIQNPEDFFKDTYYKYGFNPEVGSVGMPVADTIRATMPPEGWEIPLFKKVSDGFVEEVPNRMWDYHKYIPYSEPGKVHDQILMYGTPENLDDFCLKAQLVNYIQYRALFEGWSSQMWTKYTGVLIWKNQNPWTGLRGQFYDHLLDQTASFYGCRSAAEPVHVQLNLASNFVEVVNTTPKELSDVEIEASVWDLDGNCPYSEVFNKVYAPPKIAVKISEFKYPKSENAKPVYFLLLKLYHASDKTVISRNFYWLHLPGKDYTLLETYRKKQIPLKITCNAVNVGTEYELEINVHNTSRADVAKNARDGGLLQKLFSRLGGTEDSNFKVVEMEGTHPGVAFFLRFSVHNAESEKQDTRILPVHYSDPQDYSLHISIYLSSSLMASSSSSTSRNYSYNVFASFHGPDVRKTLLSHIREQFTRSGITMFDDQEIVRSATIAPSLTKAIRESRISIVILSKNYASSSWCLNEMVEILECKKAMGHIVMTIFYGVDPSDVRKQTGEFGIAFNETCASKTEEEKQRWRQALNEVGNIAGEDFLRWSNEAKMIKKISRDVSDKVNATPSRDFDGMVGLEPHLREMESLLDFDDDGVKVVAISGPAGIGKTTIARAVHSLHSYRFQLTCFVDNLRVSHPISFDEYGLKLHLQEEFLSNILKQDGIRICHLGVIEERLHDQRVLVILDDVNNIKQLEALAGDISWFGPGSRVVVTTENKDLLHQHGINNTYHVGFPSTGEALEILCRYAFRNSYPHDGFQELALKVTDLCGNLPLGLRVVGSSLRGKKEDEWEDVMKRLESVLDRDIEEVLRVGYESLDENEQTLFLHIAVFFNYENGNLVKTMFADSDLDVKYGLKVLENRSLIELYNKKETINMHRLLQQVGIKAIHKQEPWKRRILIDAPEICDVLELAKGTRFVSGISFDISDIDEVSISPIAFKRMPKLRFLRVYESKEGGNGVIHVPEEMEFPCRLRLLEWKAYPNKYLPPTFHPEYLVKLDMQGSQLEYLWQGTQPLTNLKEIDLQRSFHLKELPDLSNATNLKGMYLSYCQSLVEFPPSCSSLDKLKDLWMDHCTNLQVIPAHMKLASLKRVSMKGCSRLRHIPLMSTNIRQMDISETAVEDVPASASICARPMIYSMIGCQRLKEITHLPLYVTELDLRKSSVEKIPDCIKDLRLLLKLKISGCRKLTSLPELPSQLMLLSANDCESLEEVASPFHNPNANMSFTNCFRLRQQAIIQQWFCLGSAFLPGRQVPPEFDHRARGCSLTLPQSACTRFKVCLVLLPNNKIKEDRSSLLLCRRVVNGDLANSDDKSFYFNISRCRAEHLFIFPSGLFEEDEGLPDEVHREIVFEFSSKYNDFDVVECGAKFLTDENSYESESDQAATTIASFMGAMNVDPTPIIASLMRYESMMAEQSDERATVQLFIVNVDNQHTTSCCRNISSLVSSVYSRY